MKGHAEHDDAGYVPKELFEQWKTKDPIERFERHLLGGGLRHAGRARRDRPPGSTPSSTPRSTSPSPPRCRRPSARSKASTRQERGRERVQPARSLSSTPSARACCDEMSARPDGLPDRRGHRRLRRRLQPDRGPARRVRRGAGHRHADLRVRLRRRGDRRGDDGHAAGRRVPVHRLHRQRLQHDRQLRRHEPLPLGPEGADGDARAVRRAGHAARPSTRRIRRPTSTAPRV